MLRALARPLLASWFIYGGVQNVLEPERNAALIADTVEPKLAELGVPELKATDVVKIHGAATVACAALLALSRTPRAAALGLAGLAGATAVVAHPFWKETEPARKELELELFLKNVSLVGGVLLAAAIGHSPRHIARKKARKVKAKEKASLAHLTAKEVKAAKSATKKAKKATKAAECATQLEPIPAGKRRRRAA